MDVLNIIYVFDEVKLPSQRSGGCKRGSVRDIGEVYRRFQFELFVDIVFDAFQLNLVDEHVNDINESFVFLLSFLCWANID